VLFDLVVAELEHLQFVGESRLRRLRLCKVVNHFSVRERLLHVLVVEVDNCVAVGEGLPLHPVVENDFLFAVLVNALDLAVVAHVLLHHFLVLKSLAVVLFGELQAEVLFLVGGSSLGLRHVRWSSINLVFILVIIEACLVLLGEVGSAEV